MHRDRNDSRIERTTHTNRISSLLVLRNYLARA